jgi:hypothetical protein
VSTYVFSNVHCATTATLLTDVSLPHAELQTGRVVVVVDVVVVAVVVVIVAVVALVVVVVAVVLVVVAILK